jgi:hypothetical protein
VIGSFIDDGYTLKAYLKESPGFYSAVRFTFRPLTKKEGVRLFENWNNVPVLDQLKKSTAALASHIKSWNVTDSRGTLIDCTKPESYERLPHAVFERMLDIIGQADDCGDPDPDDPPKDENAESVHAEGGVPN